MRVFGSRYCLQTRQRQPRTGCLGILDRSTRYRCSSPSPSAFSMFLLPSSEHLGGGPNFKSCAPSLPHPHAALVIIVRRAKLPVPTRASTDECANLRKRAVIAAPLTTKHAVPVASFGTSVALNTNWKGEDMAPSTDRQSVGTGQVCTSSMAARYSRMILTFGDERLTSTVSTVCPRHFATTPRRLLLGKAGPQGLGCD
jgi:hypothetical protein